MYHGIWLLWTNRTGHIPAPCGFYQSGDKSIYDLQPTKFITTVINRKITCGIKHTRRLIELYLFDNSITIIMVSELTSVSSVRG